MQIIHNFKTSLQQYIRLGKNNDFPPVNTCPLCKAQKNLEGHGFYSRNAVRGKKYNKVTIKRLHCSCCKRTFSILPSFLHPRFQYTIDYMLLLLKDIFIERKRLGYYQLRQFYKRRFLKNLNRLQIFFRDQGYKLKSPNCPKEKAIKLFEMIVEITDQPFSQRFHVHFGTAFMAT